MTISAGLQVLSAAAQTFTTITRGFRTMGNQFDLRCPSCDGTDEIDVQALVWIRLLEDGTDAYASEDGSSEWDQSSKAHCGDCGFFGRVKEFEQQPMHEGADIDHHDGRI